MSEIVTNKDRAAWAGEAVDFYKRLTESDNECTLQDFLTDLRHYCDVEGIDFHDADGTADIRYLEELEEELEWGAGV